MVYMVLGETKTYYFQRNLQGDVVGIYDENGTLKVKYNYDAWGNCTISSETTDYPLAHANPIRYRGYYYDEDTGLYYLNERYYSPLWRRFISPDDTAYIDPETPNGLNLYCYCNNDPINCKHSTDSSNGLIASLSISSCDLLASIGSSLGDNVSLWRGRGNNPAVPSWMSIVAGAASDIVLMKQYLNANGIHSKFAYATNTRYMYPKMGGTWRWFGKSNTSFASVVQGSFKQIIRNDARAGLKGIVASSGKIVGLSALVNFGFNYYANNWQLDLPMINDTVVDTAIGVSSYYLAAGTVSIVTAGLLTLGVSLPGTVVIGSVVVLSIGFEHIIRAIFDYWD